MELERVIAVLKQHEPELRTAGVISASLFGSVARGENPANDRPSRDRRRRQREWLDDS